MADNDSHTSNRQHRTAAEINEILAALEQSGLSRASFAREHGIGYSTLCSWIYRSRQRKDAPPWVEVSNVLRAPSSTKAPPYRVEWANGMSLELSREFETQKVGELINLCLLYTSDAADES